MVNRFTTMSKMSTMSMLFVLISMTFLLLDDMVQFYTKAHAMQEDTRHGNDNGETNNVPGSRMAIENALNLVSNENNVEREHMLSILSNFESSIQLGLMRSFENLHIPTSSISSSGKKSPRNMDFTTSPRSSNSIKKIYRAPNSNPKNSFKFRSSLQNTKPKHSYS